MDADWEDIDFMNEAMLEPAAHAASAAQPAAAVQDAGVPSQTVKRYRRVELEEQEAANKLLLEEDEDQ